jgi:1-deoxy-D-xylulose-5-phosphate synthase
MDRLMEKLIDTLALPSALRSCSVDDLQLVADELRNELIDSVSESGGHFASSLGVTELTVALHSVFETPDDRIVWDVGHQGYIHKMLTGRRGRMGSVRQKGGISGFLKRNESEYDTFGAGHAGTSISAAVGMAVALKQKHENATLDDSLECPRSVVAVIGDGSITAGMALEALNHAGDLGLSNLIVVLNDNDMSIAPNVGAMSWLFSQAVTSDFSNKARQCFKGLHKKGLIPELVYKAIDRAEEATQSWMCAAAMLFESFGFRYIGQVDGHDMGQLIHALRRAKTQDVPVLVHVRTKKGAGFEPAEVDPVTWHGVVPFDRSKGVMKKSSAASAPSYTKVFSDTLIKLAHDNPKIVGITAAMPGGTGIDAFQKAFPERTFDVGISEQHAVTFAAGLACEGLRPVCAIYSTFLQRGFDQVLHDVGIQKLPVVFAMDRAGVVGNDGETHHGLYDISYLRVIPDMVLFAPRDENELQHALYTATTLDCPVAVRYPRGNGQGVPMDSGCRSLPIGKAEVLQKGKDILFLCSGPSVYTALEAAAEISSSIGLSSTVVDMRCIKPLDQEILLSLVPQHRTVCTIEDHTIVGGFGAAILEELQLLGITIDSAQFLRFGAPDSFVHHANQSEQHSECGYDVGGVVKTLLSTLSYSKVVGI